MLFVLSIELHRKITVIMATKDKREELLKFIDKNAFDVILKASDEKLTDEEKEMLGDVKRKTESEKRQFHEKYSTAEEVKKNYLSDVHSKSAKKVNEELKKLKLPTLPDLKDQFQELCRKLDV